MLNASQFYSRNAMWFFRHVGTEETSSFLTFLLTILFSLIPYPEREIEIIFFEIYIHQNLISVRIIFWSKLFIKWKHQSINFICLIWHCINIVTLFNIVVSTIFCISYIKFKSIEKNNFPEVSSIERRSQTLP